MLNIINIIGTNSTAQRYKIKYNDSFILWKKTLKLRKMTIICVKMINIAAKNKNIDIFELLIVIKAEIGSSKNPSIT